MMEGMSFLAGNRKGREERKGRGWLDWYWLG